MYASLMLTKNNLKWTVMTVNSQTWIHILLCMQQLQQCLKSANCLQPHTHIPPTHTQAHTHTSSAHTLRRCRMEDQVSEHLHKYFIDLLDTKIKFSNSVLFPLFLSKTTYSFTKNRHMFFFYWTKAFYSLLFTCRTFINVNIWSTS